MKMAFSKKELLRDNQQMNIAIQQMRLQIYNLEELYNQLLTRNVELSVEMEELKDEYRRLNLSHME